MGCVWDDGISPSLSPKDQEPEAPKSEGRRRCMSQLKQREQMIHLSFSFLLYSSPEWIG